MKKSLENSVEVFVICNLFLVGHWNKAGAARFASLHVFSRLYIKISRRIHVLVDVFFKGLTFWMKRSNIYLREKGMIINRIFLNKG
jgi:hypothetical protein